MGYLGEILRRMFSVNAKIAKVMIERGVERANVVCGWRLKMGYPGETLRRVPSENAKIFKVVFDGGEGGIASV